MTDIIEAHGRTYTRCCGTCRHWKRKIQAEFRGPDKECGNGVCQFNYSADANGVHVENLTLDLAICSKWQEKDEG